ncbi:MAG: WD40/YVTN/BNR-like repeat-containing protein [Gammaproteobacteria bacterium]
MITKGTHSHIAVGAALAATLTLSPVIAQESAAGGAPSTSLRSDFLDAAFMPGPGQVYVSGHYGMVAKLDVGDDAAKITYVPDTPNADFTALVRLNDSEALIGGSTGRLYHFDGNAVTEVAELSEYEEPILDIAASGDSVWVVGARGLVQRSTDGGKTFEEVEIREVTQPKIEFPGAQPADWYFGVSNLDVDTVEFTAFKGGEPAVDEEDYIMYPDEGFVQIQQDLDMDPPPSIAFTFSPGPPFRAGDVSWNVVMLDGNNVTLAGEFGMILQSTDNGETWIRRDTEIVPREPEPAYWMTGVQQGEQIWLGGAAGVSQRSVDAGATWTDNPKPGREGIFGITLSNNNQPIIAGAVGLVGTLKDGDWQLADRTALKLLSWLRTPVALPDGSVLVTGGRASAIRYKDGSFSRIPVGL